MPLSSTARFGDGVFGIGLTAFPTEPRGAAGPSGISASSLVLFCGITGLAAAFFGGVVGLLGGVDGLSDLDFKASSVNRPP